MPVPARLTSFYEIHYLRNSRKEVVVVEKANMTELDAWLSVILIFDSEKLYPSANTLATISTAKAIALSLGLSCVRWNKTSKFDTRLPSIFIYGAVDANGLFVKSTDISPE